MLLKINNISKSFDGLKALNNLSLEVKENSLTALIGPNGCGKSTLFNIISAVLPADENSDSIIFDGIDILGKKTYDIAKYGLSRTYQDTRLFKELTVLENLMLPPKKQIGERILNALFRSHFKKQEEELKSKALKILELLDITHMAYEYAKNLSGGQSKLVDIGRVLMSSPKMLLLDEPTAGVNPALTEKLFQKIVELKNNLGLTILLIEHDMDVIMRAEVDHVYVANQGEIITHGSPEEVKQNKEVIEAYLGK